MLLLKRKKRREPKIISYVQISYTYVKYNKIHSETVLTKTFFIFFELNTS